MSETFTRVQCSTCGVVFAVESQHHNRLRASGGNFYCTNGHPQTYGASEADKLRRQLDLATKRSEYQAATIKRLERQSRAAKGQITKLRKASAYGVSGAIARRGRRGASSPSATR